MDELVEVVDREGRIERVVTRSEMRSGVLRHRSTYVVLCRPSGSIVVHRRADWKDVNPGLWDLAFGGVVAAGEEWLPSAERELSEEAGVTAPLEFLGPGSYDETDGRVLAMVYRAVSDAELTCPDGEVAETAEVEPGGLQRWLSAHSVCTDSLAIVLPYLSTE